MYFFEATSKNYIAKNEYLNSIAHSYGYFSKKKRRKENTLLYLIIFSFNSKYWKIDAFFEYKNFFTCLKT